LYWFKDSQVINNGEKIIWKKDTFAIKKSTNELEIREIQTEDEGNYTCYFRGINYFEISLTVFGEYTCATLREFNFTGT